MCPKGLMRREITIMLSNKNNVSIDHYGPVKESRVTTRFLVWLRSLGFQNIKLSAQRANNFTNRYDLEIITLNSLWLTPKIGHSYCFLISQHPSLLPFFFPITKITSGHQSAKSLSSGILSNKKKNIRLPFLICVYEAMSGGRDPAEVVPWLGEGEGCRAHVAS